MRDRVGILWRPELAAGILANLDRIDVVEVVADDYVRAPRAKRRALRTLAVQVPVRLHSVGLGLASSEPVEDARLDKLARLVDEVRPELWSEHLAFVRASGWEIGHLAAPPRNEATIEATLRNLARARALVGMAPLLENVATLMDTPGSTLDEATWIKSILGACDCPMLLDLHNLYCNATNFGFDAERLLSDIPRDRIAEVHLAGGRMLPAQRLLDDHLHDVPEPVYALLTSVAARVFEPLTVILERDGHYPPIAELLSQLDRAREALKRGRENTRWSGSVPPAYHGDGWDTGASRLATSRRFEAFLASILIDDAARRRFLADPRAAAGAAGLSPGECDALERIDRTGLELAATSFAAKRTYHSDRNPHLPRRVRAARPLPRRYGRVAQPRREHG